MKFSIIGQLNKLIVLIIFNMPISAGQAETLSDISLNNLLASPLLNSQTQSVSNANEPLSCKTNSPAYNQLISNRIIEIDGSNIVPVSMEYLNDKVKIIYDNMRNKVIRHVTMQVALSLFDFKVDGFAPENIATYVSDGTKPFLPFVFANGVKITHVTPQGGTIIYRTEIPIPINNRHALPLSLAGKITAVSTVCSDMKMVDDLLGRHIVIQYDYYDSNGVFFSSFTING